MSLKSWIFWIAALWVGVLVHVDWHVGRSGHDHRSFDLTYHWLLALPTFAPVAWIAIRNWPGSQLRVGAAILCVGVLIGQLLEPLSEVLLYNVGVEPFTNRERWVVFAQFIMAGIVTLVVSLFVLSRSRLVSGPTTSAPAAGAP